MQSKQGEYVHTIPNSKAVAAAAATAAAAVAAGASYSEGGGVRRGWGALFTGSPPRYAMVCHAMQHHVVTSLSYPAPPRPDVNCPEVRRGAGWCPPPSLIPRVCRAQLPPIMRTTRAGCPHTVRYGRSAEAGPRLTTPPGPHADPTSQQGTARRHACADVSQHSRTYGSPWIDTVFR